MSIAATIGAVGAVAGAGASFAGASTQADAATYSAQLQAQEAQNALDFQKQEFATQQKNLAPFLAAGTQAEGLLSSLTSTPGEGLLTPWTGTFKPPTVEEARATPGYEFQLTEGERALQNSAAASGGLLAGGAAKGFTNYAEGLADTTYQQTYSNALKQYELAYNQFQQNQTNTFNRLATQAGVGQTTASTLGTEGSAAAGNVANISLTSGAQQGAALQNAAAATASGYVGASNALTSGLAGVQGTLTLQQLLAQQNNPYGPGGINPESYPGGNIDTTGAWNTTG